MGSGSAKSGKEVPAAELIVCIRKSAYLKKHSTVRLTSTEESRIAFAAPFPRKRPSNRPWK